MIVLIYFAAFLIIYGLLYWFMPRGLPVYEFIRLPIWVLRMEMQPKKKIEVKKFSFGDHFRQYLLYYKPAKVHRPKKHIIIYIHGGGWQFGRPEMFRPNAQTLVERGYHVFMPTHRRIPVYNITHIRSDMVKAMKKIKEILEEEGLMDKKLLIGGMSSGANLAGLLTFDSGLFVEAGWSKDQLAGAFLLGPPINLHGMWKSPPLYLLAGKRSAEEFKLANPMDHLRPNDELPILILHPRKDGLVEYQSVLDFCRKANDLGYKNLEFHSLPNMVHMDAASWCFEGHPSRGIVLGWLDRMERLNGMRQPEKEPTGGHSERTISKN